MGGWDRFYRVCEQFIKLVYMNVLWVLFTMLGLGIFGIFPATIALFTVVRHMQQHVDEPIGATFWAVYKKEWLRGNSYALIAYIVLVILAADFYMIYAVESLQLLFIPTCIIAFIIVGTLCFFFPVYVQFELSFWQYIKQAFLFTLVSPLTVLIHLACCLVMYALFNMMPGAIPLFIASICSYVMMKFATKTFNKIADKKRVEAIS